MTSMFKRFDTDPDLEKDGVWIEYEEGQQIKLARIGGANMRYINMAREAMKPYKRKIDTDSMPDALVRKIMGPVYAETILLDWRGVKDLDDKDLPYSKENVVLIFERFPEFFADVSAEAVKLEWFYREEEKEDIKNL